MFPKIFFVSFILPLVIFLFFHNFSMKKKNELSQLTAFECGYTSYFYSRFSFSIHYFMVAMIFLFLDLELCAILPMFSSISMNIYVLKSFVLIVISLFLGLMIEWFFEKLDWIE